MRAFQIDSRARQLNHRYTTMGPKTLPDCARSSASQRSMSQLSTGSQSAKHLPYVRARNDGLANVNVTNAAGHAEPPWPHPQRPQARRAWRRGAVYVDRQWRDDATCMQQKMCQCQGELPLVWCCATLTWSINGGVQLNECGARHVPQVLAWVGSKCAPASSTRLCSSS